MASPRLPLTDIFPSLANEFDKQRNENLVASNGRSTAANSLSGSQNEVRPATRPSVPVIQLDIGPPSRHKYARSLEPVVDTTKLSISKGHLSTSDRNLNWNSVQDTGGSNSSAKLSGGLQKSKSASNIVMLAEDLEELHQMRIIDDKPNVKKIHEELKSEFKRKKYFEAYFQEIGRDNIGSREGFQFPAMFPLANATKGYRPLKGLNLRKKWQVERSGDGKGEIRSIRGICFTAASQLAITEEKNARVQIFSLADGTSHRILTGMTAGNRPMQPAGICAIPGSPLLAVADLNRLQFLDPTYKGEWSSEVAIQNKVGLTGVTSTPRGDLVLTDTGIKPSAGLYEVNGKVIGEFKVDWRKPVAVTVSWELGITFVSDSDAGCVYMFDQDGTLLSKLGNTGNEDTRLVHPYGLCCLRQGTCLLVSDRATHRVLVYDIRKRAVDHLLTAKDGICSPVCLASSEDRHLALSEETCDLNSNSYKLNLFSTKMSTDK